MTFYAALAAVLLFALVALIVWWARNDPEKEAALAAARDGGDEVRSEPEPDPWDVADAPATPARPLAEQPFPLEAHQRLLELLQQQSLRQQPLQREPAFCRPALARPPPWPAPSGSSGWSFRISCGPLWARARADCSGPRPWAVRRWC